MMKKKSHIIGIVILVFALCIVGVRLRQPKLQHQLNVASEDAGVDADDLQNKQSRHEESLRLISQTGNYVREGNEYYRNGSYKEAANSYNKALALDPGSRTFVGFKLIETYETMELFDDALKVLNEIELPTWSDYGHQKAAAIRARLLAAKNAAIKT